MRIAKGGEAATSASDAGSKSPVSEHPACGRVLRVRSGWTGRGLARRSPSPRPRILVEVEMLSLTRIAAARVAGVAARQTAAASSVVGAEHAPP